MSDGFDHEREQLKLADQHIIEGEQRLKEQLLQIEEMRGRNHDPAIAEKVVITIEQMLIEWETQRDLIVERIRTMKEAGT